MIKPGDRFGSLIAQERIVHSKYRAYWACLCDCGQRKEIRADALSRGITVTCQAGIHRRGKPLSHGGTYTSEYKRWDAMIQRCHNPKNKAYPYYGARGIAVCDRWRSFENFLSDMGRAPPGMTLDRIDNDKGYEPSNCRWATWDEQAKNKRAYGTSLKGIERVADFCRELEAA